MNKETVYEPWEALKGQLEATSKVQKFSFWNEFFAFSCPPIGKVSTHTAKVTSFWDELNNGLYFDKYFWYIRVKLDFVNKGNRENIRSISSVIAFREKFDKTCN